MLNVALVGAGRIGQMRAALLDAHPRVRLVAVVDPADKLASEVAAKYEHCTVYTSLDEALLARSAGSSSTDTPIDAVWVSSPTFTHEAVIATAAKQGLPIFTEKPVAEDAASIARIFDLCQSHNAVLCCGFQRRFDVSYVALREAVRAGRIGTPRMVRVFFADHPPPPLEFLKLGGDPFMDLSPHDVDFVRWLLEDEPVEIYGCGSSSTAELAAAGVLDNATLHLKFSRGAVCSIMMSRSASYGYDQRCEVFGDRGLASVHNESRTQCVIADAQGVHHDLLKHSFPERFRQAFQAEVDAFVATALDNVAWPVSRQDCLRVQEIADLARRSCAEKSIVRVDPPMLVSHGTLTLRFVGEGVFGSYIRRLVSDQAQHSLAGRMRLILPSVTRSSGLDLKRGVIEDGSLDAVYICTPDALHGSQATMCLQAGKHVLVEKPVECMPQLARVAEENGRILMVGFQRRFDAEFQRARARVQNRQLRPVSQVVVESMDPVPADADLEFVMRNSVCHDVDMLHWLWPEAGAVHFTQCDSDPSRSAISLTGTITLSGGMSIPATIRYAKCHTSYVQRVILDGVCYGYDYTPRPDANTFCDLYRDAYVAQWKYFLDQIALAQAHPDRAIAASRERLQGYERTFAAVEQAASLLAV